MKRAGQEAVSTKMLLDLLKKDFRRSGSGRMKTRWHHVLVPRGTCKQEVPSEKVSMMS